MALERTAQGCSWPQRMYPDVFRLRLYWLWHGSAWFTSELRRISCTFRCIVCQVWEKIPLGVFFMEQGFLSLREESFPEDSCGGWNTQGLAAAAAQGGPRLCAQFEGTCLCY